MSGYVYLDQGVKDQINKSVKGILNEMNFIEPPVNHGLLYTNEKLNKYSLKKDEGIFKDIEGKIGKIISDSIRGILLVEEKSVLIRDDGYEKRNNFVYAHEFGHWKLPWHKALLYKCSQFDLSPSARKQMEREANYFSSELCFMGSLFKNNLFSSTLSMQNIKNLSNLFNMSIEATLRRSAELENRPCALLSLKVNEEDPENLLSIRYVIHSDSFKEKVGEFDRKQTFSDKHALAIILNKSEINILNKYEFIMYFGDKRIELKTEVWKNDWNIFALCQPA